MVRSAGFRSHDNRRRSVARDHDARTAAEIRAAVQRPDGFVQRAGTVSRKVVCVDRRRDGHDNAGRERARARLRGGAEQQPQERDERERSRVTRKRINWLGGVASPAMSCKVRENIKYDQ